MQPCARRLVVLHKSSFCSSIRRWPTASKRTSWGQITWTASITRRQRQQVKVSPVFNSEIPWGHHPRRHYTNMRGQIWLLPYKGKGESNSLCLLLMFRGLNDVLQDWIQQQILLLPPFFLMTLWFNPSLFTIPRKMFQSPLDLWSDTSNLCLALACLSFVFYCTQAHPIFRAIRRYHICFIYSMSHKSGSDNLSWFPIRKCFHVNIWTLTLPLCCVSVCCKMV